MNGVTEMDVNVWLRLPGPQLAARMNASDVARYLGVSSAVVGDWLKAGWLVGGRNRFGMWRIRKRAVRRMLADFPQTQAVVAAARLKAIKAGRLPGTRKSP
jgi:hypothetical protein